MDSQRNLSRRERQIMEVVYRLREATAEQVRQELPDNPANASVRTLLRILEVKGHLVHRREGKLFIYSPVVTPEAAGRSVLRTITRTFYQGSPHKTLAALLSISRTELSREELDELKEQIEQYEETRTGDRLTPV
ncbi:MAG: BlaI/MecI/CopY family transcriptional regulator [Candidatus Latescibacterota bacterium]|jgi:predicted transcriptional regulator